MNNRTHRMETWRGARGLRFFTLLTFILGIAVSVAVSLYRVNWEQGIARQNFEAESQQFCLSLERELELFMNVLQSLGDLHDVSAEIDDQAFAEFVEKGLLYHRHILGIFGWAPLVTGSERSAYEEAMQAMGHPAFEIRQMSERGKLLPAGMRDDYFPVSYVVPRQMSGIPLGFDLAGDARNREAIEQAADVGGVAVGGEVILRAGTNDVTGRLVLAPIHRRLKGGDPVGPDAPLGGLVFAVLNPSRVLARITELIVPAGMRVFIYDRSGRSGERLIYPPMKDRSSVREIPFPGEKRSGSDPWFERQLDIEGLSWFVLCDPSPDFLARHRTILPTMILCGGLFITVLISLQLLFFAGNARRVERMVAERTEALRQSNAELEREIEERRRLQQEILNISTMEKRRVGQDLHDSLGQQLTGVGLLASALARSVDSQAPELGSEAHQVADLLKQARSLVRRMARGLSPVELDAESFPEALERLAADMEEWSGVCCGFDVSPGFSLADDQKAIHLYHIAQEALNNAIRHGEPAEVQVRLEQEGHQGILQVSDDGQGIDPNHRSEGLGLKIMRYRAEMIGAQFELESSEQGTKLACKFECGIQEADL